MRQWRRRGCALGGALTAGRRRGRAASGGPLGRGASPRLGTALCGLMAPGSLPRFRRKPLPRPCPFYSLGAVKALGRSMQASLPWLRMCARDAGRRWVAASGSNRSGSDTLHASCRGAGGTTELRSTAGGPDLGRGRVPPGRTCEAVWWPCMADFGHILWGAAASYRSRKRLWAARWVNDADDPLARAPMLCMGAIAHTRTGEEYPTRFAHARRGRSGATRSRRWTDHAARLSAREPHRWTARVLACPDACCEKYLTETLQPAEPLPQPVGQAQKSPGTKDRTAWHRMESGIIVSESCAAHAPPPPRECVGD